MLLLKCNHGCRYSSSDLLVVMYKIRLDIVYSTELHPNLVKTFNESLRMLSGIIVSS